MFGRCTFLLDLALAGAPRQFLLHSAEGAGVNDSGMIVLNIEFRPLAVVRSDLLTEAVGDIGLVDDGIALVFFV